MSKTIKITLAVSVLLNVLLIGVIIGSFSHRFAGPFHMRSQIKEAISKLPEDKREMVMQTMNELKSKTKVTKKKVSAKRKEIIEVLTAPEFDGALFDQKVAELHDLMGELAYEVAAAAKKIASNLDQEQRIMLSEFIKRGPGPLPPRPHPHGGGWEDWEGGPPNNHDGAELGHHESSGQ